MSIFSRVDPTVAGPNALGVLIPPGRMTIVVLRPKGLMWDLLPARWEGEASRPPRFCQFPREEAPSIARGLVQFLEDAVAKKLNPLETFGNGRTIQIWLRAPELFWILCRRLPGEAYSPAVFPTLTEAEAVGEQVARFVWPPGEQEIYFNTQKFQ